MDGGTFVVCPDHWHFCNFQSPLARDKQNFRIEAPARNLLQGEDGCRRPPCKCLEAALRVAKGQSQKNPQVEIKSARIDSALERLPVYLQGRIQPPRADGDVRSCTEGGKQFGRFRERRREVSVGEQQI